MRRDVIVSKNQLFKPKKEKKNLEQPTSLTACRSAWPKHPQLLLQSTCLAIFLVCPNAKRVWVCMCACSSMNVCDWTYAFLCVWVYVWESAWCLDRMWPFCLRRGRQSKHRHELRNEQPNPRFPWDVKEAGWMERGSIWLDGKAC